MTTGRPPVRVVNQRDAIQRIAWLARNPVSERPPVPTPLFRPFRFGPSWRYRLEATAGPFGVEWVVFDGTDEHRADSLAGAVAMVGHYFVCSDRCRYRITDARDRGRELPPPAGADLSRCACCGASLLPPSETEQPAGPA